MAPRACECPPERVEAPWVLAHSAPCKASPSQLGRRWGPGWDILKVRMGRILPRRALPVLSGPPGLQLPSAAASEACSGPRAGASQALKDTGLAKGWSRAQGSLQRAGIPPLLICRGSAFPLPSS
ncbi:Hypothetical predicted protein [Podarcis lilfordi]|uniref:Uncharacterized protein n=1 Tax=Podarcis lilfordi TaxID=74358 RepID=A0AA35LLT6_9SAUR|nr:Hypothetical predicted protein [Podarcis lilfordi]